MADAGARGHGIEIVERLRAPLEKVIPLHIAVVFDLDVFFEGLGMAEFVHHHRVVDHQIDRHQRIDLGGVAAQLGDGITHRGKVDHAGHASKILQQHAGRAILDFVRRFAGVLLPVDHGLNVGGGDSEAAILEAEQIFQQHLHAEGQAADVAQLGRSLVERIVGDFAPTDLERAAGTERVLSDLGHGSRDLLKLA